MIWLLPDSKIDKIFTIDFMPSRYWTSELEIVNRTAIITIADVIARNGWGVEPRQIKSNIQSAIDIPTVHSIILYIDSPGGEVAGIEDLANFIYESPKPIVVYAEEMYSGAMWLGSQADYVVAQNLGVDNIGSIGAMLVHTEYSNYYKNEGIKRTIIRAPESKDKNLLNPIEPLTKDIRATIEQELSSLMQNHFIPAVQRGRGKKIKMQGDEPFTGLTYNALEALSFGLIDKIGSLEDAYEKAVELGNQYFSLNYI